MCDVWRNPFGPRFLSRREGSFKARQMEERRMSSARRKAHTSLTASIMIIRNRCAAFYVLILSAGKAEREGSVKASKKTHFIYRWNYIQIWYPKNIQRLKRINKERSESHNVICRAIYHIRRIYKTFLYLIIHLRLEM